MPSRNLLERQLEEANAALRMERQTNTELRDFIFDYCKENGIRKTCAWCGQPVWWMHRRGSGPAVTYNPDLSEHKYRCAGSRAAAADSAG